MKILYIPDHSFTLTQLRQRLGEFTLHNGCWPTIIYMEPEGIKHYQSLLVEPIWEFNGIKIEVWQENETLVRRSPGTKT